MASLGSAPRDRTKRWLVRYPRALPAAVVLLVSVVTLFSVYSIQRGDDVRSGAMLHTRTVAIAAALERRANASSAYLRAGGALLASLDEIQPDRFRRFVSELRLDTDSRGAEATGWAPVIAPDQVDAFDKTMEVVSPTQAKVHPRPSGDQPYAVPVAFQEPDTDRNRGALGFDMYSDPVRRAAMIEAERAARPTASGKVILKQDSPTNSPGFLIYMPVFEPAPGGRRLRGYIFSALNARDFLDFALATEDPGEYAVRLYDGTTTAENLLAQSAEAAPDGERRLAERVAIANSPWMLEVDAPTSRGLSVLALLTLAFGILVAALLAVMVRLLTQQALEDEATLGWFEEQASIRNSLTRELNHRVKNTLANVLSIIALTRRRSHSLDDFADGLDGRIRALSATHDLLTNSDWGTTPVRAVIEAELLPYTHKGDHETDLLGPEVELAPNDALSLGLAVHELATNAAKYGALSRPGGKVTVHWRPVSDVLVRVEWEESGGPPVSPKRGRGFGTDLIERIVAHELKNPVELTFAPEGVRCMLTIPVRERIDFSLRAGRAGTREAAPPPSAPRAV